ncbi:hypothetical protein niasHS_001253 [Heterodera schachtii]|uniref:UDP-glucuronosyltransferase n=2 Tax=Heterodera TaxID=34509 RepID=A0ABD2KHW7_HETSC
MFQSLAFFICLNVLTNIGSSLALKILFVHPAFAPFNSHFAFGLSLAKSLANDGHDVHLLATIRDEAQKLSNESADKVKMHYKMTKSEPLKMGSGKLENDITNIEILNDLELMNKLKSEKFDVGIAEAFMMTEYSLAVFHFLEIPKTIATHSQPMSPVHLYLLGVLSKMHLTNRLASVGEPTMHLPPDSEERRKLIGTRVGDHRNEQLKKRGPEIWEHCINRTMTKIRQYITEDPLYQQVADQKYKGLTFPGFGEIFKRTRFFLINSQPDLDFNQFDIVKDVEKVKFIGGFNLKPIPNPELKFPYNLDSKKGVVLVSFGTVVNTTVQQSSIIIEAIAKTIKMFPDFLFIWKLSEGHPNKTFLGLKNVIRELWVDQKNILAYPKTVAFVSHCGMNSVLEGIYNGVPMVCVPFFGDQFYNAESLARQNIGLVVDREQDKKTVQQQLTVALAKALGQNELLDDKLNQEFNHPEDKIDLVKLEKVTYEFRQKDIAKTLSDVMKVIDEELKEERAA